jgi:hypothetical protein
MALALRELVLSICRATLTPGFTTYGHVCAHIPRGLLQEEQWHDLGGKTVYEGCVLMCSCDTVASISPEINKPCNSAHEGLV